MKVRINWLSILAILTLCFVCQSKRQALGRTISSKTLPRLKKETAGEGLKVSTDFAHIMSQLKHAETLVENADKQQVADKKEAVPAKSLKTRKLVSKATTFDRNLKASEGKKDRKLAVVLDDLNKLKWQMRQSKKQRMEKRIMKKLSKQLLKSQQSENAQGSLAKPQLKRGEKQNDRQLGERLAGSRGAMLQRKALSLAKPFVKAGKWIKKAALKVRKAGRRVVSKFHGRVSRAIDKNNRIMAHKRRRVSNRRQFVRGHRKVHFNEEPTYSNVHHRQIRLVRSNPTAFAPQRHLSLEETFVQPQNLAVPQIAPENASILPNLQHVQTPIAQTVPPAPRALSFAKPSFSLRKFDFQSNIKQLEVNVKQLLVCSNTLSQEVTTVSQFEQQNAECYKDYIVTVKLLTQIELWNQKLIYKYVVTKENYKVYQKYAQESGAVVSDASNGVPAVAFSQFYQTLKAHYSEFNLKVYHDEFEGKSKLETEFYDRNYESLKQVSESLNRIDGLYQLNSLIGEFQNEIYGFKSLNTLIDSHESEQRMSLVSGKIVEPEKVITPSSVRIVDQGVMSRPNFIAGRPSDELPQGCQSHAKVEQMSQGEKMQLAEEAMNAAQRVDEEPQASDELQTAVLINSPTQVVAQITVEDTIQETEPQSNQEANIIVLENVAHTTPVPTPSLPAITPPTPVSQVVLPPLPVREEPVRHRPVHTMAEVSEALQAIPAAEQKLAEISEQIKGLLSRLEAENKVTKIPADDSCQDEKVLKEKASLNALLKQTDEVSLKTCDECLEDLPEVKATTVHSSVTRNPDAVIHSEQQEISPLAGHQSPVQDHILVNHVNSAVVETQQHSVGLQVAHGSVQENLSSPSFDFEHHSDSVGETHEGHHEVLNILNSEDPRDTFDDSLPNQDVFQDRLPTSHISEAETMHHMNNFSNEVDELQQTIPETGDHPQLQLSSAIDTARSALPGIVQIEPFAEAIGHQHIKQNSQHKLKNKQKSKRKLQKDKKLTPLKPQISMAKSSMSEYLSKMAPHRLAKKSRKLFVKPSLNGYLKFKSRKIRTPVMDSRTRFKPQKQHHRLFSKPSKSSRMMAKLNEVLLGETFPSGRRKQNKKLMFRRVI